MADSLGFGTAERRDVKLVEQKVAYLAFLRAEMWADEKAEQ